MIAVEPFTTRAWVNRGGAVKTTGRFGTGMLRAGLPAEFRAAAGEVRVELAAQRTAAQSPIQQPALLISHDDIDL